MVKRISIVLISIVLTACSMSDDMEEGFYILSYNVDFTQSLDSWEADFADYPASEGDSIKYELAVDFTKMPTATGIPGNGLMISGKNNNGDLFMFLKRKIGGLNPNTEYTIVFDVEVASNAPSGYMGSVEESPGEGVYLKVGAVSLNPKKVIQGDSYRMNIDKGDQGANGTDMIVIGNVGVSATTQSYSLIKRSNSTSNAAINARTNGSGEVWLIVGTDSAFRGTTTLYYSSINVVFSANQ